MVEQIQRQSAFSYEELLACGQGKLFGRGNAQLPLPPLLMFDRITNINEHGGDFGKGVVEAELDIRPDKWFFDCHFEGDPVMPGCLGLDALWQLIGFYLGWLGKLGGGRALGAGEVKFSGQITRTVKLLHYRVSMKRVISAGLVVGVANGTVAADGQEIYSGLDLRVGLFNMDSLNR